MDTFSIDKCSKCGAERYLYNLSGQFVIGKDGRIFIRDDSCKEINLADWISSWGVRNGKRIKITVEKLEELKVNGK